MTIVTVENTKAQRKDVVHKIGNWYEHKESGELFVLCSIYRDNEVALFCVNDGSRWGYGLIVQDSDNISEEEMKEIFYIYKFELVESVKITKG